MAAHECRDKHQILRQSERLLSIEFVMQFTLVAACTIAGWFQLGMDILVIWFCVHYTLVFLEKYALHTSRGSNSRAVYFGILALNLLIGCAFSSLPIFLWYQNQDIYQFAAMALIVGATLNTLLVRSVLWEVMLCYLIPNTLAIFAIALCFVLEIHCTGYSLISTVIAISIFLYMLVAVREAYIANQKRLLAQRYLFQAQKMEAIGNLSGGIAHDFNNLLNVISGNLELLSDPQNTYPPAELIQEAKMATARGANLTKSLLAFGRTPNGNLSTEKIQPILAELNQMLVRLLPSSVDIEMSIDENLPEIQVEKNALMSALLNLAVNAGDAMTQAGKLTISVNIAQKKDASSGSFAGLNGDQYYVIFKILDTGHGIPENIIGKIAAPFFTTKEPGKGTGLGLAMVAEFASQSGGWFDISNRPSGGAKATLALALDQN